MKHTPGPWNSGNSATPEHSRQYLIYAEADQTGEDIALVYDQNEGNEMSNAQLIAAAPMMYEFIANQAECGNMCAKQLLQMLNL